MLNILIPIGIAVAVLAFIVIFLCRIYRVADIDKALKGSDDGQLLVDALVRYSVAQSGISQDNMADIVSDNLLGRAGSIHL